MANEVFSEKVSVNMNSSTLSSIDLLVDNGYYSNRSDFINQAVREALGKQQSTIDRIVEKNVGAWGSVNNSNWFLGVYGFTPREIEELYAQGKKVTVRGYGVLVIDSDCDEKKLFEVVESISLRGKARCSASVRAHYGL